MALGPLRDVTLAQARAAAAEARALVRQGQNPIEARRIAKRAVSAKTFADVADEFFETQKDSYRSEEYKAAVERQLKVVLAPLRPLHFDVIDTEQILRVLKPLWVVHPETAKRLREKIEAISDLVICVNASELRCRCVVSMVRS